MRPAARGTGYQPVSTRSFPAILHSPYRAVFSRASVRHTEGAWLDLFAASDSTACECLARRLAELKAGLLGTSPTPMERLIAERAAACWRQLQLADMASAEALTGDHSRAMSNSLHRRQDSAHRHYMAALSALTTVRKLLPSTSGPPASRAAPDAPAAPSAKASAAHQPAPEWAAREAASA